MRRFVCACALAVLAACTERDTPKVTAAPVEEGPEEIAEKEPNDRPEQAPVLARDTIVQASLNAESAAPDVDWYVLSAPTPLVVNLAVSGITAADVVMSVYDRDRNLIALVNSEGDGGGEHLPNLTVTERALVKITSQKKGTGGAYTFTARFQPPAPGTETEPNDRAVDATALVLGEPVTGFVGHAADEDWYRLELPLPEEPDAGAPVPAPPPTEAAPSEAVPEVEADGGTEGSAEARGPLAVLAEPEAPSSLAAADAGVEPPPPAMTLRIDVTPVAEARVQVRLLSEAEAVLYEATGNPGEALAVRNVGVRAQDRVVYVVVKSARGYDAENAYTLTVAEEQAGANAEVEPNDTAEKATPLPRDGFRMGYLSPRGDEDWFVLRTGFPALARFEVSGVDRVDLELESGGLRANDGAVKEPEILNNVACPGECFVRVRSASRKVDGKWVRDFENGEIPYRLSVSVVPDNGQEEREPNATAEQATPLILGKPMRGTIHPRRDVDLYALDLRDRPVRTPIRATLLGILKVDVGLYLHRVESDGKLTLVQTADRAKGEQPETIRYSAEPGLYVFEVRDSTKRQESNFQDRYQLTVAEDF